MCFRLATYLGISLSPAVDSSADQRILYTVQQRAVSGNQGPTGLRQARMWHAAAHRICSRDKHTCSISDEGCQQRRNQEMLSGPLPVCEGQKVYLHGRDSLKGTCPGKVQDGRPKAPPPSKQVFHKSSAQIPSPPTPDLGWVLPLPRSRGVGVTGIFSRTNPCHHARSQAGLHNRTR